MKILVIDTNYVPGLNRVFAISKIQYWQKKGEHVIIFCTKEAEAAYGEHLKNITFISFPFEHQFHSAYSLIFDTIKVNIVAFKKMKALVGKFDVVYSQSGVIDFLFIPWVLTFLDKKVRWFAMIDNIVPPPHKRPGPFFQKLIPYMAFHIGNVLLRRADGIFVVTDFLHRYYNNLNIKRVIKTSDGYGVQTEIFTGKISDQTPRVDALYCGRLHFAKGALDLIEVLHFVCKDTPHFVLGILGDGDTSVKQKLLEKIKQYKLEKNVTFFGYKTGKEKGDIYRSCGVFLFLSYDEGCPHAVIEAFACNKLVIAYDLPIYHEIFARYIHAGEMVLFQQQHYKDIARYICNGTYKRQKFFNVLRDYALDRVAQVELTSFGT